MPRLILLLLILIGLIACCQGQASKVVQKKIAASGKNCLDFVLDGDTAWVLTADGRLELLNIKTGGVVKQPFAKDPAIAAIAKDRAGRIVVGNKSGKIKAYNKMSRTWELLGAGTSDIKRICFNPQNHCYLVTEKGVEELRTHRLFFPDSSLNFYSEFYNKPWDRKPVCLTDSSGNIWIGFGYGEWGGELYVFSTAEQKFVIPRSKDGRLYMYPVKSIFEGEGHVYVSAGLFHFTTRGKILQFTGLVSSEIFESDTSSPAGDTIINGEYIGPGVFNPSNHCIYFYSQHGIFKGNPQHDLSGIKDWEKLLRPSLHWSSGQPDAMGSPINIWKMAFSDSGRLVFVSELDGVGVFDGQTLLLVK